MIDLLELGRASRLGAILMLSFEATGDGVVQVVITGDDVDADVLSSQSTKLLGNVLVTGFFTVVSNIATDEYNVRLGDQRLSNKSAENRRAVF